MDHPVIPWSFCHDGGNDDTTWFQVSSNGTSTCQAHEDLVWNEWHGRYRARLPTWCGTGRSPAAAPTGRQPAPSSQAALTILSDHAGCAGIVTAFRAHRPGRSRNPSTKRIPGRIFRQRERYRSNPHPRQEPNEPREKRLPLLSFPPPRRGNVRPPVLRQEE